MKYFAAILLSLFLLVPVSQAHNSTETVTYKIDGVEYPHPDYWVDHNDFLHRPIHIWEYSMGAFDHVINNLDRRIDHLNNTLKSLYLITCGSALARPDECNNLAARMSALIAHNKSHTTYTCPFNLMDDVISVLHDNNLYVHHNEVVGDIVRICRHLNIQDEAHLGKVSKFMKNWLLTDDSAIIYEVQFGGNHITANFNEFGFIEAYRASTPR